MGVAVAQSDDPDFAGRAAKIAGVRTVTQDRIVQWTTPNDRASDMVEEIFESADASAFATGIGGADISRHSVER